MKISSLSLLTARLSRLLTSTKPQNEPTNPLDVGPRPDPAVVAKFRELDRAGCSVDEILASLRNTRTAGTSR